MHDLQPITALGAAEPRVDTVGTLSCHEVTTLALASVAARLGQEAACGKKLRAFLGTDAPGPAKAVLSQLYSAVWMGPEQWMIGGDDAAGELLADIVKSKLGTTASVTEQSDAWCCFDLSGQGIVPVMELLCNINIRAMQSGDAQRTSIHHLGCFVVCGDPGGFVRILGPRASAGSLHHAIVTAMKSAL
ncbi:sarcosine oxidase subunit gamma [Sulfitobacter sp. SK012]|uniref:sarcosine oxidase subunit gamma n=1 Tax=Sulfitobacter sp. SK012 TaxID=1389005 RepID=UPI000E0A71A7|nr:sarcosine oxidase subunit gamma [Sulfitobacter sp. SK012]AXI47136.1 sarcosine oxidase subunit gamma [Sulfitobacter sp. SK012]